MIDGFQLNSAGPPAYERYLVPAFFAPCADQLLTVAPPRPGERVLDLACGTGIVARRAASYVGDSGRVVGVDVNPSMTAFANDAAVNSPGSIEWRTSDAHALPLEQASIDVACCQQGLQFFADPLAVLREIRRVLAPGGRLLLAVWRPPGQNPAFEQLADALDRRIGPAAAGMMRAPFNGPDPELLREWLTSSGFPVVNCRIAVFLARFPSVSAFLQQEAAGSPLAGPLGDADPATLAALTADLEQAMTPFVDDLGVAIQMQTWLVLAHS